MSEPMLRPSRIVPILLLASLCLNVLLSVYVGTQWLKTARAALLTSAPPRLMELVASRLPTADAKILWNIYRSKEQRFVTAQSEYKTALLAAGKALAEPTIDEPSLRALITQARDKRLVIGDLALETFVEAIPQISEEGRRDLLKNLKIQ